MNAWKLSAILMALAGGAAPVFGQSYPAKPVRIIVTAQAGSGSDVATRYFADAMGRATGQKYLVENRLGAGGNIGMAVAAKAPADGYTLVLGSLGTNVMNQFLYSSLGFDPEKDFEPIGLTAKFPFLIAVNPSFPATTVQGLVAEAKAKPGTINFAVTSTTTRMPYELFSKTTGAPFYLINYNGPGPAIPDVIAGRVQVIIETAAALRSYVTSGQLRPLAITTRRSSPLMPELKSVAEQGVQGFDEFIGWAGFFAPAGTPQDAIRYLNTESNKVLAMPDTLKRFQELGFEPGGGSPQDLAAYVVAERLRWGPIIKAAGLKVD